MRSGEYLGPDWPYNFLGMPLWSKRRYNVSHHALPASESTVKGVNYLPKLNVWQIQWFECGKHYTRKVRTNFGFMKGKYAAEGFKRSLDAVGRVDSLRN